MLPDEPVNIRARGSRAGDVPKFNCRRTLPDCFTVMLMPNCGNPVARGSPEFPGPARMIATFLTRPQRKPARGVDDYILG